MCCSAPVYLKSTLFLKGKSCFLSFEKNTSGTNLSFIRWIFHDKWLDFKMINSKTDIIIFLWKSNNFVTYRIIFILRSNWISLQFFYESVQCTNTCILTGKLFNKYFNWIFFIYFFLEMVSVERTFLPCFKDGEPNLIICPQSKYHCTNVFLQAERKVWSTVFKWHRYSHYSYPQIF